MDRDEIMTPKKQDIPPTSSTYETIPTASTHPMEPPLARYVHNEDGAESSSF